jgi:hypothetical protein
LLGPSQLSARGGFGGKERQAIFVANYVQSPGWITSPI